MCAFRYYNCMHAEYVHMFFATTVFKTTCDVIRKCKHIYLLLKPLFDQLLFKSVYIAKKCNSWSSDICPIIPHSNPVWFMIYIANHNYHSATRTMYESMIPSLLIICLKCPTMSFYDWPSLQWYIGHHGGSEHYICVWFMHCIQ